MNRLNAFPSYFLTRSFSMDGSKRKALRISAIVTVWATVYILLTYFAIFIFLPVSESLNWWSTTKDVAFVVLTAIFLYWISIREFRVNFHTKGEIDLLTKKYSRLLQNAYGSIAILDEALKIQNFHAFEIDSDKIIGHSIWNFIPEEDQENFSNYFSLIRDNPLYTSPIRFCLDFGDGKSKVVEAILQNALSDPHVQGYILNWQDVSEETALEKTLNSNELKLRYAAENGKIFLFTQTPDLVYNWIYHPKLGWNPPEFIGKKDSEIFPEKLAETLTRAKSKVLETKKTGVITNLFPMPGGYAPRYFTSRFAPFYEDDKLAGIIGIAIDVTDERKLQNDMKSALEGKEVLLQELHHRIKNNFAIVSSLIHLSSLKIDDPVAKKTIQDCELRIKAMAIVHENVYNTQAQIHPDISEFFRRVVLDLYKIYGAKEEEIKTEIRIDLTEMAIDKLLHLGLALSELLAHSFVHSLRMERPGKIQFYLVKTSKATEFGYSDNGVGLQELESEDDNLALLSLEAMAKRLGGEIEWNKNHPGMHCKISIPDE